VVRSKGGSLRLLVLVVAGDGAGELSARVDGAAFAATALPGEAGSTTWTADLGVRRPGALALDLAHPAGVLAAWVVPLAPEIPPPPPREWDAGAAEPFDAPSQRGLESAP
jgi:hypothetical protein